jgi:predicted MFS family arabinose efflux permease
VIECLLDPQTWLISLITISSNVPNGAVSSYQATLIKSFGFDAKTTALLQLPSGAVSIISIITATYLAGRFDQRGLNIITLLIPGALGGALMAFLPADNKNGKLIGNYLTNCIGSSLPLLYSWVAANVAGHYECYPADVILSRQHHWAVDVSASRRARFRASKNYDHCYMWVCCVHDAGAEIILCQRK